MDFQIEEQWRPIKGYEDKYWVSNLGRITNKQMIIMKPKVASTGAVTVSLYKNSKNNYFIVARLVAQAFIPNPDHLTQVRHKDRDKQNNRVDNLKWSGGYLERKTNGKFKLSDEFYFHLHKVEENYGSIATAPEDDMNVIALKELVGNQSHG